MRRFRRSERGLSEIVGTLMLVVIVVAAATLLAAFVASYQKQLQTEETFSHDQSLESIQILGLTTTVSAETFTSFNFTLASEYVNPSGILDVYVNGDPLLDFGWYNVSAHSYGTYNAVTSTSGLAVLPFEQVVISTCLLPFPVNCTTPGGNITDSFLPGDAPAPNHYIKFDVLTHLHNDFSRVYLPPTPLAVVSELNPSGNNPITLLDGSTSFQPGGNASIVDWTWTIAGDGLESTTTTLPSKYNLGAETNGSLVAGPLNGTNATATFTVPSGFVFGPGDSLEFTPGSGLSASPSNCTPLTGSKILAGATGTVSGTTLTVTFSFTTTLPTGCTDGALSLPPSGMGLNLTLNESGEEYELSPALAPLASHASYSVTLGVTNSDGLEGAVTITYQPVM